MSRSLRPLAKKQRVRLCALVSRVAVEGSDANMSAAGQEQRHIHVLHCHATNHPDKCRCKQVPDSSTNIASAMLFTTCLWAADLTLNTKGHGNPSGVRALGLHLPGSRSASCDAGSASSTKSASSEPGRGSSRTTCESGGLPTAKGPVCATAEAKTAGPAKWVGESN